MSKTWKTLNSNIGIIGFLSFDVQNYTPSHYHLLAITSKAINIKLFIILFILLAKPNRNSGHPSLKSVNATNSESCSSLEPSVMELGKFKNLIMNLHSFLIPCNKARINDNLYYKTFIDTEFSFDMVTFIQWNMFLRNS